MTTTNPFGTEAFHRYASRALLKIARIKKTLIADDVWAAMPVGSTTITDPRALGSFMTTMAKQGIIKSTNSTRKSPRRRSYTRVWKSLIFGTK